MQKNITTKKNHKRDKYLLLIWAFHSFEKTMRYNLFYLIITLIFDFMDYGIFGGFLLAIIALSMSLREYNHFKEKNDSLVLIEAKRIFWLFLFTLIGTLFIAFFLYFNIHYIISLKNN